MKHLGLLIFGLCALTARAGTLTVTSDASKSSEALALIPQEIIGILVDAHYGAKNLGKGVYEWSIPALHCDNRYRGALDTTEPLSGVPTTKCRINSENIKDSTKGMPLGEARAIQDQLSKLQDVPGTPVYFEDCAMGYCGTFAKSITCTVDTKIETYSAGRFSCTFDDGN